MRYLDAALTLDGTLSAVEEKKRRILFYTLTGLLLLTSVGVTVTKIRDSVSLVGHCLVLTGCCWAVITILCKRPLTTFIVVAVVSLLSTATFLYDLSLRPQSLQSWYTLILMVDLFLVMQTPPFYTKVLVVVALLWVLICAVEDSFRFGLYDVSGLVTQAERVNDIRTKADCDAYPCRVDFPPPTLFVGLGVFMADFFVTRKFADDLLKEQASMGRTISVVQEIATLLGGYDVERVAGLLEAHEGTLPREMSDALRRLEQNLRMYKAYLPQTCLPFDDNGTGLRCPSNFSSHTSDVATSESGSTCTRYSHPEVSMYRALEASRTLGLSTVTATLMTLVLDTPLMAEGCGDRFSDLFTSVMMKTLSAVEKHSGMVDVFVGHRVHCSFNASRLLPTHISAALDTVSMLVRDLSNAASSMHAAVATGKMYRGDMGCAVMRRFSMVGALVCDVHSLECAGRLLKCAVMCNRTCFVDAEQTHPLRLLPFKVELDADSEAQLVAELLVEDGNCEVAAPQEWMYELGSKGKWEDYNTAVRGFLAGNVSSSDLAAVAERCGFTPIQPVTDDYKHILCLCEHRKG